MAHLLPGITARRVPTDRLTVNVLEVEGATGAPVVLVHGNLSSGLFWQRVMLALPTGYRPVAVDLRGFGDTDPLPVDATCGVADYADDVAGLVAALGLGPVHLVGWSMGGGVVLRLLRDRPAGVRTVTLVNPVSPFGFGGTRGVDGQPWDDLGTGAGGGAANPEFVRLLAEGDRSEHSPFSPRQVMRSAYFAPPFRPSPEDEDMFVESMLSTRTGDAHYPGDSVPSAGWPGVAAGRSGVLNTMAPNHFRLDDLHTIDPKPPIRWIRGDADQIVSDTSMFDLAHLGALGAVPGWPGERTHGAQPMVTQTRAVLDRYGRYDEVVIAGAGHSPHIEKPAEFGAALREILAEQGLRRTPRDR